MVAHADAAALAQLSALTGHWLTDTDEEGDTTIHPATVAEAFGARAGDTVTIHAVFAHGQQDIREAPEAVEIGVENPHYSLYWTIESADIAPTLSLYFAGGTDAENEFTVALASVGAEPGHDGALHDAFDRAMDGLDNYGIGQVTMPAQDAESQSLLEYTGTEPGEDVNVHDYLYGE